jgi:hypothetical protein
MWGLQNVISIKNMNNNPVIKELNIDTSALSAEELERLDTLKAKISAEEAKWSPKTEKKPWASSFDESSIKERLDAMFEKKAPAAKWWQSKKAIVALLVTILWVVILNSGYLISHMAIYGAEACLLIAEQSAPALVSEVAPTGSFWAKEKSNREKVHAYIRTARLNLCAALKTVDAPAK